MDIVDPLVNHDPGGEEVRKAHLRRVSQGFFAKYMAGETVLDIGYRGGACNIKGATIVPHAIGIDLYYPNYNGVDLPFEDGSVDCVASSHCLEHLLFPESNIAEWDRVLKVGGYIVCIVPHQHLYEKKRLMPSRWSGEHVRFFTPASLLALFEDVLAPNSYRIRHMIDNDVGFDYALGPDRHSTGCFEIELVLEKIVKPSWELA